MDRYFRPLSGNYISQSTAMVMATVTVMANFRPLSGNYISQSGRDYLICALVSPFPSPVGELHFSIQTDGSLHGDPGFRPLSGNYISQSVEQNEARQMEAVSVPCRGTTFLNLTIDIFKRLTEKFPSPVGELHFSICTIGKHQRKLFPVSVPYRGTTFLNQNQIFQECKATLFPSPVGELHFSII